jgi:RNA polymerase primary sigma factor
MPASDKSRRSRNTEETLVNTYMAEVAKIPMISAEEERKLLARVKAGDRVALNSLVSSNLRFVVAVCWNYRNRGVPMPDLINEGNLALFHAAEQFNPVNNVRFMSYAVWWLRQAILSAIARQGGTISLPPDRIRKTVRFRRAAMRLAQKLGREPYPDELETALGGSGNTWTAIAKLSERLSVSKSRASGNPLDEVPASEEWCAPDAEVDMQLIRKALRSLLRKLSDRQQKILALRFGLENGTRFSLTEVGSILSLTRERVRQIEERALSELRRSSRSLKA